MQLIGDVLEEVAQALRDAGIKATADQTKFQLPGALVIPGTMTFDILDGDSYSMLIEIYLFTSNRGSAQSFADLQDLLTKVRSVYQIPQAEPISYAFPNISGPDPVPGLVLTLQATITEE